MKIKVVNTEGLTKFESALVRLANGCSFDRRFLDEESGKYAAKKLFGIAVEEYKQSLSKPADGDYLPEIDREVIVLLTNGKVCFAHRPNPDGWDGKNLLTEETEHFTPKTYDAGGWNLPYIMWWLDLDLPKMEE